MLEVRDDNGPARSLYEHAGFEVLTTRRRYYQPGDVDAHIMRRPLKEETP
jgi:ribosomal-protein-alanine N-acetyltransferase